MPQDISYEKIVGRQLSVGFFLSLLTAEGEDSIHLMIPKDDIITSVICGCRQGLVVWLYGCMNDWLYGCMNDWLHGCMVV